MAGFEVIVRPVIFPNIRPAPTRSLPPEEDPGKGLVVLGGAGGGLIALTRTETHSISRNVNRPWEIKRKVSVERVYQQKDPDAAHPEGKIDKENYVDVERASAIRMQNADGTVSKYRYSDPLSPHPKNIELMQKDKWIINQTPPPEGTSGGGSAP
jgi:hypothetical protein